MPNNINQNYQWLDALRKKAKPLLNDDYPDRRNDEFRFTNFSFINKNSEKKYSIEQDTNSDLLQKKTNTQNRNQNNNQINLFLDTSFSIKGLKSRPILENENSFLMQSNRDFITAKNAYYFNKGVFLEISDSFDHNNPIRLNTGNNTSATQETFFRNEIHIKEGCNATVVEDFGQNTHGLVNSITEIFLEKNAQLQYIRLQNQNKESVHLGGVHAYLSQNAKFFTHLVHIGAKTTRLTFDTLLKEENAETNINGLAIMNQDRANDFSVNVHHLASNTKSDQLYHSIASDESSVAFTGKIQTPPKLKSIEANQLSRALLESEKSNAYGRPQLDILAEDVKCTHGSTISKPNDEAIFYMMARGIDKETAEYLQKFAFIETVIKDIPNNTIKDEIKKIVLTTSGIDGDKMFEQFSM